MDYKNLQQYLESKPFSTNDFPFGPDVHVFRVGGKMFALISLKETPLRVNLKCDPDEAAALRDIFKSVIPGYHMNKQHWNTVILDGDVPVGELERMIDNSYKLIYQSLPKSKIESLEKS
ncbi:MmcQ/YjbR family DNA-binding protein [Aliikangiella sp. G2MR2-5]|uniref:MmcQ/YjbR family DNA-binding protein n=1 Tax=Aliikangiella sp. G2MR2-5 TaxID=2788943 RepID=UPI0018AA2B47|nr:MmcQ/YjbR family DNA-binding protein [Aliikangiella sp. G2MR2-5]